MELLDGDTLEKYSKEHKSSRAPGDVLCGGLEFKEVFHIPKGLYKQMRPSLHALASGGVLHGDPNSGNVFVAVGGRLQFLDFGYVYHADKQGRVRATIDKAIDDIVSVKWGCHPSANSDDWD